MAWGRGEQNLQLAGESISRFAGEQAQVGIYDVAPS